MATPKLPSGTGTTIMRCTCKHPYQDAMYGFGKRVHNNATSKKNYSCKCTVCGKEK